jgi:hypothetical protein
MFKANSYLSSSASIRGSTFSFLAPCLRAFVVLPFFLTACSHPSAANNALRAENDKLQREISNLNRRHDADEATIHALEQKSGTVPTLPEDRLEKLFTVHGITLGKLTGDDPDNHGFRVAITPIDDNGDKLKAAGSISVDAYDLAAGDNAHLGHWDFDEQAARANWFGSALLYGYVLKIPWQKPPTHPDVTVKATFTDALTHRQFTAQKVVKIKLPPTPSTTQPTRSP